MSIPGTRDFHHGLLGHESIETTQIYLHADLQLKEKAMDQTKPVGVPSGRYQPPDELMTFLEAL